uniref:Reverse transcriptase domain-containing protein n=1 Tax=Cannabis sativa TaxID=3483 RepID=A0A803QPG7_CANSA
MKILSWNCWGIRRTPATQALLAWVRRFSPACIFLMETKCSEEGIWEVARLLGYQFASIIPAVGIGGGFALLWNGITELEVLQADGGVFEVLIKESIASSKWCMFAIYGRPYDNEKRGFWDWMEDKINKCSLPWMVIGYLNLIAHPWEKCGGRKVSASDTAIYNPFCKIREGLIERLDRAVVSGDWITAFPEAMVTNAPISVSDHGYILMDSNGKKNRGFKPFRFFEAWARESSCEETIRWAWCEKGRPCGKLSGRLNDTRTALRKWKNGAFGDFESLIKEAETRLGWIQVQPVSSTLLQEESALLSRISELSIRKESMWRQKSREIWLKVGDRNSKFFHASTVIRRRRNGITANKNRVGGWETKTHRMGTVFNEFFGELYKAEGTALDGAFYDLFSPLVTVEENTMLKGIPSPEEVWNAVATMHPLKAPGPDGMPGFFYRRYWEIVGNDVLRMVQNFFSTGTLEKQLNYTFICLIPKEENACTVDKFRLISLCNFAYKIISKIIATRLRGVIDKLISPFQSAFVPGRWIAESSILTQELVHTIKRKKGKGGLMAIKLDMLKAYDRIEWHFLHEVLKGNGFDSGVCSLIMECVSSVSFSVLINGVPQKKFEPKRGLRQGDPLSPFLFLLCHDVFSKLIMRQQAKGLVQGISLSRSRPAVSHLMFADDTILFARANERMASSLLDWISIEQLESSGGQEKVEKDRYLALARWEKLCKPTVQGGLGFRKLEDMNKALLAKLAWQFVSKDDRPWVTCFSNKYCSNESFWSVKNRDRDSAFWRGILNTRDIICNGSITLVGKGDSVDIWKQPWIPWLSYEEFTDLMNRVQPRFPSISSLADMSNPDGSWNMELLKDMFGDMLGTRIGNIARLPFGTNDTIVWKEAGDGRFTVKRGYEATLGDSSIEDAIHIFWECHCARALWFSSPFPICCEVGSAISVKEWLGWALERIPNELNDQFLCFTGCLIEGIWKARNEFLFKGKLVDIATVRESILRRYNEYRLLATTKEITETKRVTVRPAVRNGSGWGNSTDVFCMTDASWKDGRAGIAVGLLDRRQGKTFWFAKFLQSSSPAEEELLAIKWAMELAAGRGFQSFAGASDAKVLIDALEARQCPPLWKLKPLALEVLNLCNSFNLCNFFYVKRIDNSACDAVARWARNNVDCNGCLCREGSPFVIPNYIFQ